VVKKTNISKRRIKDLKHEDEGPKEGELGEEEGSTKWTNQKQIRHGARNTSPPSMGCSSANEM
jgi:hypothetical protein